MDRPSPSSAEIYLYSMYVSIYIYIIYMYMYMIYKTPTSSPYAQSIYNLCSLCKIKGSGICHISKLGVQESTWKGHSVSSLLPLENSTIFLVAPWRSPFCQLPSQARFSLATTEWICSYANSSHKKKVMSSTRKVILWIHSISPSPSRK